MSEASKAARSAMRAKATKMANGTPGAKVDASSWTPSEPLNTTTKTGARPVRPRIYKAGGKVQGDRAKPRGDKLPRQITEAYTNRNVPMLNGDEFGKGHVGAFKKGGRAHKNMGGPDIVPKDRLAFGPVAHGSIGIKTGGKVGKKSDTYFGGTRPTGGRMPRASGGRTKGKTNIMIHIGNPQQAQNQNPASMQGPVRPPMPVPVPPPQGMPQGMPMPPMSPPPMGGQMAPPQAPMMRKNGGRIKGLPPKTASSFKDMKAGAGGGLGRLEKTAIAKKQYGSPP